MTDVEVWTAVADLAEAKLAGLKKERDRQRLLADLTRAVLPVYQAHGTFHPSYGPDDPMPGIEKELARANKAVVDWAKITATVLAQLTSICREDDDRPPLTILASEQ